MIIQWLIGAAAITALSIAWVGVQALVRRGSNGHPAEEDVLACRTCCSSGMCRCGEGVTECPEHGSTQTERKRGVRT